MTFERFTELMQRPADCGLDEWRRAPGWGDWWGVYLVELEMYDHFVSSWNQLTEGATFDWGF